MNSDRKPTFFNSKKGGSQAPINLEDPESGKKSTSSATSIGLEVEAKKKDIRVAPIVNQEELKEESLTRESQTHNE
jgi:hypothetical protein